MSAPAERLHQTQDVKLCPSAWLAGSAEATCNHHNTHAVLPIFQRFRISRRAVSRTIPSSSLRNGSDRNAFSRWQAREGLS